jgi:hypothetical protein
MKKIIPLLALCAALSACTSIQQSQRYADQARANAFSYFFPSSSGTRTFASLEEASDFVNAAEVKLGLETNKRTAKGLSAKLIGPGINRDESVVVSYLLLASTKNANIDLSNAKVPLERMLSDAISVSVVFLVFYKGHGVSISDFYLADGYEYRCNSQFSSFTYSGTEYKADYPIGWGCANAFNYLKEEAAKKE